MLKKLLFTFAITTAMFSLSQAGDCFAGNDMGKLAFDTSNVANDLADYQDELTKGKLVWTRTLIHEEVPVDTQIRRVLRAHLDKHLGKKITIKVRAEQEYGQNGVHHDPTAVKVESINENQLGAKFCVTVNKTYVTNAQGERFVSDNPTAILDVVMEKVETLISNPENIIVIDVAPETETDK